MKKARSRTTTKTKKGAKKGAKKTKLSKVFVAKVKKALVHSGERKQVIIEDLLATQALAVDGDNTDSSNGKLCSMFNHQALILEVGNHTTAYPAQGTQENQYIGANYQLEGYRWKYWIGTCPIFCQGYITRYVIRAALGNPLPVTIGAAQSLTTFWEDMPTHAGNLLAQDVARTEYYYENMGRLKKGFTIVDKLMFSTPFDSTGFGTGTYGANGNGPNVSPLGTEVNEYFTRNLWPVVQNIKLNLAVHAKDVTEAATAYIPHEKKFKYYVVFVPHEPNCIGGRIVAGIAGVNNSAGLANAMLRGLIQHTTFFRDN